MRLDRANRCDAHQLPQTRLEKWGWWTLMQLTERPEQIGVELERKPKGSESEQHLVRQAIVGLQQEILRLERQKEKLLDLWPTQSGKEEDLSPA